MSTAAKKTRITTQQYLAQERCAEFKSEFFDGVLCAMSGASREHNLIASNLNRRIGTQLEGRPCEVYISDMRVRVSRDRTYTYPDVVAVSDEPKFLDGEFDTLLNPSLIIEVLSPSTEAHDRGGKFRRYREIESLREYVLISQDHMLVERFSRRGEQWLLTVLTGEAELLRLDSIGCVVALGDIYDKVKFFGEEPSDND